MTKLKICRTKKKTYFRFHDLVEKISLLLIIKKKHGTLSYFFKYASDVIGDPLICLNLNSNPI